MRDETVIETGEKRGLGRRLVAARARLTQIFVPDDADVEVLQLKALADRALPNAIANSGFGILVALVMSGIVPAIAAPSVWHAALWLGPVLALAGAIFILSRRFAADNEAAARIGYWRTQFAFHHALNASAWGLMVFFLWEPNSNANAAFLIVLMLGVLTSTVVHISQHLITFSITLTLIIGLMLARLVTDLSQLNAAVGALLPFYAIWIWHLGHEINARLRTTIMHALTMEAMAARLEASRVDAEIASRAKSTFLATMSHELRTPLNAIIGFSEMMLREVFGPHGSPKYKSYADDIFHRGQHLLTLVNDVLDMSKIETGKMELREEQIDLARLIEECARFFSHRAQGKGVALSISAPGLRLQAMADPLRLKQVLLNLISNAVKFTPKGGRVSIRVSECSLGGALISVQDTGIGMQEKDISRAFEAFQQLDSDITRSFEGTGLGLPIAKALIELHGGRISMKSAPMQGTVAEILLPPERITRLSEPMISALQIA